ncbi:site-specific DNA-methyltransferase [bacterium]|nr:site-specific DNA-methyltransferase [bacterium]
MIMNNFFLDSQTVERHKATVAFPQSFFNHNFQYADKTQRVTDLSEKLLKTIGTPYYCDLEWGFFLYNNDCIESMEKIQKEPCFINLVITSPPYNIGKEYESVRDVSSYIAWCEQWLDNIYNIITNNGTFWLNLGFLEIPGKGKNIPITYLLWDKSNFYLEQEIVWHYEAGVAAKKRLSPRNEKWLFYVKDEKNYTFNLDDIRDPNVKYPNQKKNGKLRCNPLGKNPSDVWCIPKVTSGKNRSSQERTSHPAQFPLEVIERIVKLSSNPGDIILDPFSGSGTTGICACGLNRSYIGFEINKDYCDMTIRRFESFKNTIEDYRNQLFVNL